jgi:hypothetical protein
VWADRKFRLGHGRVFALYVAAYTAGRFWIELMRTDPATMVFGQRINVLVSVVVFIGAVVAFFLAKSKGEREDLSALTASEAAADGDAPKAEEAAEPESTTAPDVKESAKVPDVRVEAEKDTDTPAAEKSAAEKSE